MKKITRQQILQEYDRESALYGDLASTAAQLVEKLLRGNEVVLHSVTQRQKTRPSLEGKLRRPGKSYSCLTDITDLAAIRLTTYFSDDVDRIAAILERELEIDWTRSIDKRNRSDPDRFGYQSLHFIAKFSEGRCRLPEYARFSNRHFEIQLRSILQHAWAEIEHDLGYKSALEIPFDVRRRFARVAGLLELADSEFSSIRSQLNTHKIFLPEQVEKRPRDVPLDRPTLNLLIESDPIINELDLIVCREGGGWIDKNYEANSDSLIQQLSFFGINNVEQLKATAHKEKAAVRAFVRPWVEEDLEGVVPGIGLFYLAYVLANRSGDITTIDRYLDEANIDLPEDRPMIARMIMQMPLPN